MKIELHLNESQDDLEIHIHAKAYTPEVAQLMQRLQQATSDKMVGYLDKKIFMIEKDEIYSIFSQGGKVYYFTTEDEYEAKQTLYELENMLVGDFVRVNKSTLVNLEKIVEMQMKYVGMMELALDNETTVHVSRKYLPKLKQSLGIGGK